MLLVVLAGDFSLGLRRVENPAAMDGSRVL